MANGNPWADAPVFVDAIANEQEAPIVRVTYLTIECVDPAWGWSLGIQGDAIPIGLLGLAAVVLRPFDDELFRLPSQFDDLISRVESQPGFSVDTGDLWLPRFLFEAPQAGDVFRMSARLFGVAHQYRYGRADRREFEGAADTLRQGISFSAEETKAYHQWHNLVTRREPVEKNPDLRLQIRGDL
jgi:hypothetical protein